jgi:hypothetical protein
LRPVYLGIGVGNKHRLCHARRIERDQGVSALKVDNRTLFAPN